MNKITFMKTKDTDALSEAYTMVTNVADKVFFERESKQDTYDFLKSIATQINLYRVAIINKGENQ